jgi:hypothetical protein
VLRRELRTGTIPSPLSLRTDDGRRDPVGLMSGRVNETGDWSPAPYVTTVLTPGAANVARSGSACTNLSASMVPKCKVMIVVVVVWVRGVGGVGGGGGGGCVCVCVCVCACVSVCQ